MAKKIFLNTVTGEVIFKHTKLGAMRYFKTDGKKYGYSVKSKDVLTADGIVVTIAQAYAQWLKANEAADGNA